MTDLFDPKIISGKLIASGLREKMAKKVKRHIDNGGRCPGLAVIIVGNDPASAIYVRNKNKACAEVGIYSEVIELPEITEESELLNIISVLNMREDIDGILVQLPLPKHIKAENVINAISPDKDVDAFHPVNVGKLVIGKYKFAPCTPSGVMYMLKERNIQIDGKHCVVIGRSNIVGKPMALLMLHAGATVTVCHSHTVNLEEVCRSADILVSAVGKADFVNTDMVKEGAVVVDVGINRGADGKISGDVDFESVYPKASHITPVPGGVGPMTISMLLYNTLVSAGIELE